MYQIEKDLCGFRLTNRRYLDEVKAELYELTHVRSGAQLIWLAREDNNKTFGIAFRTLPEQMVPDCKYLLGNWPRGAWHESKITVRFWITTIILAAITIITLKVR